MEIIQSADILLLHAALSQRSGIEEKNWPPKKSQNPHGTLCPVVSHLAYRILPSLPKRMSTGSMKLNKPCFVLPPHLVSLLLTCCVKIHFCTFLDKVQRRVCLLFGRLQARLCSGPAEIGSGSPAVEMEEIALCFQSQAVGHLKSVGRLHLVRGPDFGHGCFRRCVKKSSCTRHEKKQADEF